MPTGLSEAGLRSDSRPAACCRGRSCKRRQVSNFLPNFTSMFDQADDMQPCNVERMDRMHPLAQSSQRSNVRRCKGGVVDIPSGAMPRLLLSFRATTALRYMSLCMLLYSCFSSSLLYGTVLDLKNSTCIWYMLPNDRADTPVAEIHQVLDKRC